LSREISLFSLTPDGEGEGEKEGKDEDEYARSKKTAIPCDCMKTRERGKKERGTEGKKSYSPFFLPRRVNGRKRGGKKGKRERERCPAKKANIEISGETWSTYVERGKKRR